MTLVCPGFTKLASFLTASHAKMTAEMTHQKVNREDAAVTTERVLYLLFQFVILFLSPLFLLLNFSECISLGLSFSARALSCSFSEQFYCVTKFF